MCIPVMLVFVTNHDLYFCHGVVDTFEAAVTTRGVALVVSLCTPVSL